jgi:hypothetical protein
MQAAKMFMLSAASSLLLGAVAHAEDSTRTNRTVDVKAEYEGTDAQGRSVRLTIPDIGVATLVWVSPDANHPHRAELHWTARIGTGTAASFER